MTLSWTQSQVITGGQVETRTYRCEFQSFCISNLLCYKVCSIIKINQRRGILGGKLLFHRNYCWLLWRLQDHKLFTNKVFCDLYGLYPILNFDCTVFIILSRTPPRLSENREGGQGLGIVITEGHSEVSLMLTWLLDCLGMLQIFLLRSSLLGQKFLESVDVIDGRLYYWQLGHLPGLLGFLTHCTIPQQSV